VGSASNVLFGKDVYPGLVIKNSWSEIKPGEKESSVRVASGTELAAVVEFFARSGFAGLEWAGGLPGTIGGAVRGNAGAFAGETKDSVVEVESLVFNAGLAETVSRPNKECAFGYRGSIFKQTGEIILEIVLKYKKAPKEAVRKIVDACIMYRKQRLPLEYPSAGSFFKNVPVESAPESVREQFKAVIKNDPFPIIPAAALTAELGLKGRQIGGAQVSEKHPNFIINKGGATYSDIVAVAELVEAEVYKNFSIKLEREVQVI
jgi:UDP-N-acetylmuramate dehydrogenase